MQDTMEDYHIMAKWLSDQKVLEYYGGRSNPFDLEKVINKFAPRTKGDEPVIPCIIEFEEQDIGYIQYYRIMDDYDTKGIIDFDKFIAPFGMDLFIGETDFWNKGIGTKIIQLLIRYLLEKEEVDAIFIDPQTWNKRAIRCYEKSGFKPITIIQNREEYDGVYKDNLIMSISPK